ncbi:hypothetical protein AQUSIP_04260 [Aquicella siphonis]|uniref:Uncharacterized protein n=1 Tax=Aquicella siphonis TaxID=254247 RepID=A0A5E4PE90_9COXI|nr:hypothetical protein [Aquicella siphonis]VVC75144.1 hypothetical protein AQUSIP_04260 [Aquicella siphonis]
MSSSRNNNSNQDSTAVICELLGICCGTLAAIQEEREAERQHILGNHGEAERHLHQAAARYHAMGAHEAERDLESQAEAEHNEHRNDTCCFM